MENINIKLECSANYIERNYHIYEINIFRLINQPYLYLQHIREYLEDNL